MKATRKIFDEFLEKIIDENEKSAKQDRPADDFGHMLALMKSGETEFQFDRRHIKAILMVSHMVHVRYMGSTFLCILKYSLLNKCYI